MNEDISCLNSIDVDSIVGTIASRYEAKKRYTWVGSDVMIAIDPSSELDFKESIFYAQSADEKWSIKEKVDAPVTANLLEVVSNSFMSMIHTLEDQTIVLRYNLLN
jgi:myosin heavy subunit